MRFRFLALAAPSAAALLLGGCVSGVRPVIDPVQYTLVQPKPPAQPTPPPPPVPVPPPAPMPAPAMVPVIERLSLSADVLFGFNKAVLTPAGREAFDELVTNIRTIHLDSIVASGYTDGFGSVSYNQSLSQRRADAVKAYLVGKGIPPGKITAQGMGRTDFRVQPQQCHGSFAQRVACQAPNRRVDLLILGSREVMRTTAQP